MKNKGFTLVELLAVIAILSIISLIAVPTINNSINASRNKAYESQIKMLQVGAKSWGADNVYKLPAKGATTTVTVGTLKSGGYVDSNATNPKTNKKFADSCVITIRNTNGKLTYEVPTSGC